MTGLVQRLGYLIKASSACNRTQDKWVGEMKLEETLRLLVGSFAHESAGISLETADFCERRSGEECYR
jgi:hypothetical protein